MPIEADEEYKPDKECDFVPYAKAVEQFVPIVGKLSLARDIKTITAITCKAVRELTGADGSAFILGEEDFCHYADEDAIAPLWKGQRLAADKSIGGWVMRNRQPAVIESIYTDSRICPEVYEPTFVRSLVEVPIRAASPIGVVGAYWARECPITPEVVKILQSIADLASSSMRNVELYREMNQREKALERSEGLLRALIDSMPVGVWIADETGRTVIVNQMAGHIWGEKKYVGMDRFSELKGWWTDSGKRLEPYEWALARAIRNGEISLNEEIEIEGFDGKRKTILNSAVPVRSKDGAIIAGIAINQDITERKKAEKELVRAKEEWERTFDSVPDLIAILDTEHRIVRANLKMRQRLETEPERCVGQRCYKVVHCSTGPPESCPHALTLIDGREHVAEVHEERLGGDFLISTTPMRDERGEVTGTVHVARDITERKRMEEALRRAHDELELRVRERTAELQRAYDALRTSEEKYRELVENANSIILRIDAEGRITFFNEFAQKFFGYGQEEVLGRQLIGTIVPQMESFSPNPASCLAESKHPPEQCETIENEVFKRNGQRAWVSWTNKAIYDESGAFSGMLSIGSDITEHRRAEEKLRVYMAKLEQQNRELEDFTFISSHHVQEPLRKILTYSDKLRTRYKDTTDPEAKDTIERMQKSAQRIQALVRDLLRYSRISAEAEKFHPVRLSRVVGDVVRDLAPEIREAGAQVEVGELATLEADAKQLRHLFDNLIENGLKFCTNERPVIRIYSSSKRLSGKEVIEVLVEDNGIGFDEKYLERIFTPFQQLHNQGKFEGTGMGLAICRRIVERHHGSITARSKPGEGATFIITLPEKQPDED